MSSILHWSVFGQPGAPVTERFVPDAFEREKWKPMAAPARADWPDVFDDEQTRRLRNGFPRRDMEDKWVIWSDDPDADGRTSIHFSRSWTGTEIIRLDLQLTESGSRCTGAAWETDPDRIRDPGEQFARDTFLEICRWVLGMQPAAER